MTRIVRFSSFGGPELLELVDVALPPPRAGEARVAHRAIGVNFIDMYHRTGLYPLALPSGLGGEGAGVVTAVGPGVTHVAPGDRVAYTAPAPLGSYAEERNVAARWLVRLPEALSFETGAAMMLKGLTAWYLLKRSYEVARGEWIVLYAAAGGVGLIAAQ
jgi:NADPH2:quinone reductase